MKEYLIPDLWDIVLNYCWPNTNDFLKLCRYGHYEKISMVEDGLWNLGFELVCQYGYISMIDLIINKVTQVYKTKDVLDWNWGLYGACSGGNIEIVKLMIEKGANKWNWGLSGACYGGNIEIIKLMTEKGADHWNWVVNTSAICYSAVCCCLQALYCYC